MTSSATLQSIVSANSTALHAFAQADNFAGLSVGANVNFATTSTEFSGGGVLAKIGDTSQNASLQAAYGVALGNRGVLGFGVTYGLGDLKAGTLAADGTSVDIKAKNMYSIYIEPGYAVSNSTLAYAKMAYLGMKGEITANGTSGSENFGGVGYGAGFRTMLDKNLFLQVEFIQSAYSQKTRDGVAFKPSASTGTIGIGYKF